MESKVMELINKCLDKKVQEGAEILLHMSV